MSEIENTSHKLEQLKYIEQLAYYHGKIGREDIIDRFKISPASATNLLSYYNKIAPDNLSYNIRLKHYEISKFFKLYFLPQHIIFKNCLPIYTMPKLYKSIENTDEDVKKIAIISRAIQKVQILKIKYFSTSSGKTTREIIPVAFADNLLRLHLRAYDRKCKKYIDFVVDGIESAEVIEGGTIKKHELPQKDKEWHSFVELKIKTHPKNSHKKSFVKKIDHIKIRAAMADYFLQLWNIDCSPNANLKGRQYQYILSNLRDIQKIVNLKLAPGTNKTSIT